MLALRNYFPFSAFNPDLKQAEEVFRVCDILIRNDKMMRKCPEGSSSARKSSLTQRLDMVLISKSELLPNPQNVRLGTQIFLNYCF